MNSRIIKSIALCTFAFMTTNNAMAQQKTLNSYPVEDMNTAVRPGDNFMEYAAGTWQKKNPVTVKSTANSTEDGPSGVKINQESPPSEGGRGAGGVGVGGMSPVTCGT